MNSVGSEPVMLFLLCTITIPQRTLFYDGENTELAFGFLWKDSSHNVFGLEGQTFVLTGASLRAFELSALLICVFMILIPQRIFRWPILVRCYLV